MILLDQWGMVHLERTRLAADLSRLTDAQWTQPSGCEQWSIRDVVAHMTSMARMVPLTFAAKMASAGGSFARAQARGVAAQLGSSPSETLERFRAVAERRSGPPGPQKIMLGETIVHADDIRRPLGIAHTYPPDVVEVLIRFYSRSNLILGGRRRVAGLRLFATDTGWYEGTGPEVIGPALTLLMAATGRKAALDGLVGDGVELLRSRS